MERNNRKTKVNIVDKNKIVVYLFYQSSYENVLLFK